MKTNSGKKGEGMPVVRNPQFYFKEGFCWNNVLTTYIKCKKKQKTVQSTESMSFFSCTNKVPEYYMISLMNSLLIAQYVDCFINSTSHCTTGDAKLIPIIIPKQVESDEIQVLFNKAYYLKKMYPDSTPTELLLVEKNIDTVVNKLYHI